MSWLGLLQPLVSAPLASAAETSSAPVSALVWWIIPLVALVGGLCYAYWITHLKSKYDNQTERSVGRFRKFQESFDSDDRSPENENSDSISEISSMESSEKEERKN
jgi:hypothetical protein